MENAANHILLRGSLCGLPILSHENHGKRFFSFSLEVERLSGTLDRLNCVAPEEVLNTLDLSGGRMLELEGQIRTYNSRAETGRRLLVTAYAERLCAVDGAPANEAEVSGVLCRVPVYRRTPLGREICDVMLAVGRRYRRTDYLPCILWGANARLAAPLPVGAALRLTGRLQSREYVKLLPDGAEKRTAYELSVVTAESALFGTEEAVVE